ncbi:MAG: hypothetical protein ACJ76Y_06555 [Thermoanaerobaculia bacterium]
MNDLQRLAQAVLHELPDAELDMELNPELNPRFGWLDIEHDGLWVVVEWRSGTGFGVSLNEPDPDDPTKGLFEGPDEVFQDWSTAKDHVLLLLSSSSQSTPQKRSAQR